MFIQAFFDLLNTFERQLFRMIVQDLLGNEKGRNVK